MFKGLAIAGGARYGHMKLILLLKRTISHSLGFVLLDAAQSLILMFLVVFRDFFYTL